MLLLRIERLPEGPDWLYEVKLDGYRALAVKSGGNVQLRSRNDNDFSTRYARLTKALDAMPNETVIDGEVVALDKDGKPSFNALQNYGSSSGPMLYYVFDVLILSGRDVMAKRWRRGAPCWRSMFFRSLTNPSAILRSCAPPSPT
jgi:ATP-dependent DNA ligase